MIKRELKINFKSFIVWTGILALVYLVVFAMYPHIVDANSSNQIQELMQVFPEEALKAFNLDLADMSTSTGWLKTEGSIFLLLIYSIYAARLGSTILLKEENDKTIEFLYSKPISKNKIITSKILVALINIISMVILTTMFIIIGISLTDTIDLPITLLLCLTPAIPALVFFFITIFISTKCRKTKQTTGLSLGLVFISYFLSTFSAVSDKTEFLKYFSIHSLADSRGIIENASYNPLCIVITFFLIFVFTYLTYYSYNEKDFS